MRAFVIAFVVSLALHAMGPESAEEAMRSDDKMVVFKAYEYYRDGYDDAIDAADSDRQKQCLGGVIACGEKLHIDVTDYRRHLQRLERSRPEPKSNKTIRMTARNRLNEIGWKEGRLVLEFTQKLGKRDVNYFKLNSDGKQGYRYVFDIHAAFDKSQSPSHREIRSIRLSQYRPSTMRLVIENDTPLTIRFSKNGETLSIDPGVSAVTSPKYLPSEALTSKQKVIVIDPGHGGKDGGAVGYGKVLEKRVVYSISKKLADALRRRGYSVLMTRTDDRFIKLNKRTRFANDKNADLFISIHANAVPARNAQKAYGIETYFLSPSRSKRATQVAAQENSSEIEEMDMYGKNVFLNALNNEKIVASHKLAIDLQSSVLLRLRQHYKEIKDAGVREGPFWVLVGAQMPAALVEVGFITHATESKRLSSADYQRHFAEGLADGVERYFAKNR